MPLVKRIEEKIGKNKLQVLLLSVDFDYGNSKEEAAKSDLECMQKQGVNWPNVLVPGGFDNCQRTFNLDGYGLTLIDPDGIVRGVDVRPNEVAQLLGNLKVNLDE